MSDFPDTAGVRSVLPSSPVQWVWIRLRVYLVALASAVLGFFLVAKWIAKPDSRYPLELVSILLPLLTGIAGGFLRWRYGPHGPENERQAQK
jgi:uncharacterized protein YneF (UPF0154 family)